MKQHGVAEPAEIVGAPRIMRHPRRVIAAVAIDLDDPLHTLADEIHHIGPDRCLPSLVPTAVAPWQDQRPEAALRRRLVAPQPVGKADQIVHGASGIEAGMGEGKENPHAASP